MAVSESGLLARVGKDAAAEALSRPGARIMEMRGRAMPGYVLVTPEVLTDAHIADWLTLARSFVATLPPKDQSATKKGIKK